MECAKQDEGDDKRRQVDKNDDGVATAWRRRGDGVASVT